MLKDILDLFLELIKIMSVIIVVAYVLTRTRIYNKILKNTIVIWDKLILALVFGLFAIYGTLSGIEIMGAIANVRDLGPAIAGLIAGPFAGGLAGIIGAVHRYTLGGITALPCAISTIVAGLAAGIFYMARKGKFPSIFTAAFFVFLVECFHMTLVLFISSDSEMALTIVRSISLPMILTNTLGMVVFAFIFHNVFRERSTEEIKNLMESELKIARDIQMSMVPKIFPPFPERDDFSLHALLTPAKEVGGDLFDFFLLDDKNLGLIIGDVSGKGVPASLFMAVTKTVLKTKADSGLSPDQVLYAANNELCQGNDSGMFVTVFFGVLNLETGLLTYSNGGHNKPYVIQKYGDVSNLQGTSGMALGVIEDISYSSKTLKLAVEETLFIYTDGITEAMNHEQELYGEERLEAYLKGNSGKPPQSLCSGMLAEIERFASGAVQSDDITMLVIKYLGSPAPGNKD